MKLYYIKWYDCIHDQNFVIVNAKDDKDRDKKFEEWRRSNPEIAPGAYSPREIIFEDCAYLNKIY